ncbi:GNAT family N-acetyltransferase [Seohaeicola saemankumensis]|uniref:GNAT family N-acetyltransferase n=1 Tax=Seohaeicola saemankumensis TaxID=481181 RepID=A0ABW3TD75_9RHOB
MILRAAKPEDASSIAAISLEVWIGTYLKKGVSAFFADYALRRFTAAKAGMLIADPAEFILVSQNDDGIDGFIRVSEGSTAPVEGCSGFEIATFYVQPRHHGKGIGTGLLNAALAHCRSRSAASVWLTTNAENAPAIAFYLERGFVEVGKSDFTIENEHYLNNVYLHPLS